MAKKTRAEMVTPGRLDPPLVILRKVDVQKLSYRANPQAATTMELIGGGYVEQGIPESDLKWFEDGFILNDQPRTSGVTDEIMDATLGFAIARTDSGEIVREGESLSELQALVDNARIDITPVLVGMDDDADDMPEDFEPAAPTATL